MDPSTQDNPPLGVETVSQNIPNLKDDVQEDYREAESGQLRKESPAMRTYRTLPTDGSINTCSPSFSFFTFPAEIRNMIYELILSYPDCAQLYSVYRRRRIASQEDSSNLGGHEPQSEKPPAFSQNLHTPSILLLCKRIKGECLPILRSHTFIIDQLPPFQINGVPGRKEVSGTQMSLTQFVGRTTLQNLRHLDLRLGVCEGPLGSAWLWKRVVDELCDILAQGCHLHTLRMLIRICDARAHPANWPNEQEHMKYMKDKFKTLYGPNTAHPERVTIEVWSIKKHQAKFEYGSIRDRFSFHRPVEKQAKRRYPDPEMFPGSITEFLKPLPPLFLHDEEG